MNSWQPCIGYLPCTIATAPSRQCSTSCNNITPISRSGLRMRPPRYQGGQRSWDAFMSASTPPLPRTLQIQLHRQRADEVTLMQLSTGWLMAIKGCCDAPRSGKGTDIVRYVLE